MQHKVTFERLPYSQSNTCTKGQDGLPSSPKADAKGKALDGINYEWGTPFIRQYVHVGPGWAAFFT